MKMFKLINPNNRRLLLNTAYLLLGLLCIGVLSCKKSSSDADALQARLATGMVSYLEVANQVSLNGNNYNFTRNYIGVPVQLKEAFKDADTVVAYVDPALVAQYNEIYRERNLPIPNDAFRVSHGGNFPIASGSTQAKDSLYVLLNDGRQLKDSTQYLVPVSLSVKKGAKLKYSLFFFKIFVTNSALYSKIYDAKALNSTSITRTRFGALSITYVVVPDSIKFNTAITTLFPASDVTIQAIPLTDDEVNAAIIKEGFPGYPAPLPLPASNYSLSRDRVTVPAKSLLSRDSLTIRFPNKSNFPKSQWYTMGLKIKSQTGSPFGVPPVNNDSARVYIRFYVD